MVWEGRNREAPPYPDPFRDAADRGHEIVMLCLYPMVVAVVRSCLEAQKRKERACRAGNGDERN